MPELKKQYHDLKKLEALAVYPAKYLREIYCYSQRAQEHAMEDDGSVDRIKEVFINLKGLDIKRIDYGADGSIIIQHDYEYDENGNLVNWITYYVDGRKESMSYKYDERGNQIYMWGYNIYGAFMNEYQYDDKDNLIVWKNYDDGELAIHCVYEYDDNNHMLKETFYDINENVTWVTIFEYDENGTRIGVKEYDGEGNLQSHEKKGE